MKHRTYAEPPETDPTSGVRSNPRKEPLTWVFKLSAKECCWGVCTRLPHSIRLSKAGDVFNRSSARVIFSATSIPAVWRIVSSFRYFDGPFKQRQSQRNAFRGNFVYNSPIAPRYIKTCGFSCTIFKNIWANWHLKIFGVTRDVTRSTLWRYWDLWKNSKQFTKKKKSIRKKNFNFRKESGKNTSHVVFIDSLARLFAQLWPKMASKSYYNGFGGPWSEFDPFDGLLILKHLFSFTLRAAKLHKLLIFIRAGSAETAAALLSLRHAGEKGGQASGIRLRCRRWTDSAIGRTTRHTVTVIGQPHLVETRLHCRCHGNLRIRLLCNAFFESRLGTGRVFRVFCFARRIVNGSWTFLVRFLFLVQLR